MLFTPRRYPERMTFARFAVLLPAVALGGLLQACSGGESPPAAAPPPPPPPPVTVSLDAVPAVIALGDTAALSWQAQHAQRCSASGNWTGERPPAGNEAVTPAAAGIFTYTLACTGPGQPAQVSVQVEVTSVADPLAEARQTFAGLRAMEQGCCDSP